MPSVSVIIPVYNRQHSISRAVHSVLAQSFQDFELLVVDDASSDATLQVLKSIRDPRLKIIRRGSNGGEAAARNTGLEAACGEWLAWLDSDDEWLPEKLGAQMEAAAHMPAGHAGCGCGYRLLRPFLPPAVQEMDILPPGSADWFERFLGGNDLAPGSTLLLRRKVFEEVGRFDESLPHGTDLDWLLRCSRRYAFTLLPAVLAHIHQASRPDPCQVEGCLLQIIARYQADYRRHPRALAHQYRIIAGAYHDCQAAPAKQRTYFWKSLRLVPIQDAGVYLSFLDALSGNRLRRLARRLRHV